MKPGEMKMDESDYLTNLTKFYTLLLLREKPRHGYAIMDELEQRIGKRPSTGQIYPLLSDFKEKNLATSEEKEVSGRDRKVYKLTEKGEETLSKVLERFNSLISTILESQITECAHCGCEIYQGGYKEKINGKTLTFCCENCARAYKKLGLSKEDIE